MTVAAPDETKLELARKVVRHSIVSILERSLPRTVCLGDRDAIADELLADLQRQFLRPALLVLCGIDDGRRK